MSMDIKIGDKFRCINGDAIYHKLGETYVITKKFYNNYYILTLNNEDSYVSPTFLKENFVKVSEAVDLMFFIRTSIEHNKQLGDNLKKKCLDYVNALERAKFEREQIENIITYNKESKHE